MRIPLRLSLLAAAVTSLAFAAPALAGAPQFHAASSSVSNDGLLVVNFDEVAWATRTSTTRSRPTRRPCTPASTVAASTRVPPTRSRRPGQRRRLVRGQERPGHRGLTAGPLLAPQFTCPSGQRRVLAGISYTNIVLTDTTNGVSTSVPDASRTFLAL